MKREELIKTAKKLKQVDQKFAEEYTVKKDGLVDMMNKRMLARADINEMVGKQNVEMMADNHANHARFLESIFYQHSAETLVDTILWVFRAYRSRNFSSTYWSAQLNAWLNIYKTEFSETTYNEILPFYSWMQVNIPVFNTLAEQGIDAPLSSH